MKLLTWILIAALTLTGCSTGRYEVRHAERIEALEITTEEERARIIQGYNAQVVEIRRSFSLERLKCQGLTVCVMAVDSEEVSVLTDISNRHQSELVTLEATRAKKEKAAEATRNEEREREEYRSSLIGGIVVLVFCIVAAIVVASDPLDKW